MLISIFDQLPAEQATANHLGGKGYGLWWMQQQGVNVPPALIIPTSECVAYMTSPKTVMAGYEQNLVQQVRKFFIDQFGYMPLLSVRSGARVSMPGMMDTILNVGLDEQSESVWVPRLGADCVLDSYKRLITMYGNVVKEIPRDKLDSAQSVSAALSAYKRHTKEDFPNADQQILGSVKAVFDSWNNDRAKVYRKMHNIPEDWGTAVVIQAMVFGNLNENSGTGVLFTRNPDSGENVVTGEFLTNAQGEDVVAGIRTPMPLSKMPAWNNAVSEELLTTVTKLEQAKRDVQDVEFTIMDGKLYILQTRNAKRSARAALKIALDMFHSKTISREEMLKRVSARELDLAAQPVIDPKFKTPADFTGIPACSGVATGVIARSSAMAVQMAAEGKSVILVTEETTPDDIQGMLAAKAVVTMHGGSTSHAAVVARSFNRICVVGLGADYQLFVQGATLSVDGSTGKVWNCEVPVIAGDNANLGEFKNYVLDGRTLIVDRVPEWLAENVLIDLSNHVLSSPDEVIALVGKTRARTSGKLTVFLPDILDPEAQEFVGTYLSSSAQNKLIVQLQEALCSYFKPSDFVVAGWSPGDSWTAIDCKAVQSILDMVLLKQGGLITSLPMTTTKKEEQALKRIMKWLSADGIQVQALNSASSGTASWTNYVHG